ncbi:hypothetical protein [uncultured Algimonas sp.]|uniref:hypothetical protein n=1 Tax=uncultured Algimonas sp. TaxID=1547920 RepID=UPI00260C5848|nr:hypothetical protein [uncultured Algimonas sp.]
MTIKACMTGLLAAALFLPASAMAGAFDQCEIVVLEEVVDADGGRMTVASYRPADDFVAIAKQNPSDVSLDHNGAPIRGVICTRNDLVPQADDYAILATGVPLTLSQDLDSADSDILTLYFGGERFEHRYKSDYPMSDEFSTALEETLSDFSARDHGLVKEDDSASN